MVSCKYFLFGCPIVLAITFTAVIYFGVRRFLLFPELPTQIKEEIFNLSLDKSLNIPLIPLTSEQINEYHNNGYLVVKNVINIKTINAMRSVTDHIMNNPSGMLKRANSSKFCGFSLHNHILIPSWRNITYNLGISSYAAQLMDTKIVVYSQDIIHSTSSHCFKLKNTTHIAASRAHSDMNQSPYSIEKKKVFGDNMVIAWIALDNLDYITMELYDKTHKLFNANTSNSKWNPYKYCSLWNDIENDMDNNNNIKYGINTKIINLNIGDVALFQGLTFHKVLKSSQCKLNSCRRVTVRYVDGEITKWRNDIPKSMWPFIQEASNPGEYILNDLPRIYDKRDNGSIDWNKFNNNKPIIPPLKHWFKFIWHILKNGFNPGSIIFQCHNKDSYA